jgi:hypothetical protein
MRQQNRIHLFQIQFQLPDPQKRPGPRIHQNPRRPIHQHHKTRARPPERPRSARPQHHHLQRRLAARVFDTGRKHAGREEPHQNNQQSHTISNLI